MKLQPALKACMLVSLVSGVLFIALNVLRLLGIFNLVHAFLVINMLALAGIAFIGILNWRKLTMQPVEWLLFGCLFVTSLMANYTDRSIGNIVIDIIRPVLFVLVVATLRSLLDLSTFNASAAVKRLLALTVWVTLLAVPVCYAVSATAHTLYPAYSSIDSILGLGWLLAASPYAASILFMLVLFVSGKRAVYLVAFMILVLIFRGKKKKLAWLAASVAGALLLSPLLMPANVSFIMKSPTLSFMSTPEMREFMAKNPKALTTVRLSANSSLATKMLNIATGGRVDEMRDATSSVTGPWDYIIGEGPGFDYHSQVFDTEGKKHRNLHFTPLSLIIYYGVIFFALFVVYVGGAIRPAWRLIQDTSRPVLFSYGVYFLASLPFCFTEYGIFAYSNMAIACGLVMASAQKNNAVRRPLKPYT